MLDFAWRGCRETVLDVCHKGYASECDAMHVKKNAKMDASLEDRGPMKALDIVVWGATGLTGKRCCLQLAQNYHEKVKWAIAGRNRTRLETLRTELAQIHESCAEMPIVVADVSDRPTIDAMVRQADVVLACAGPFSQYSDVVVEACVKEGTHFFDVTGEVGWVKTVIDRFHEEAKSKAVKVVNCCGFDSVPADIGTYFLVDYVKKRYGRNVSHVLGCYSMVSPSTIMFSGGTLATIILMSQHSAAERKKLQDLFILNPPGIRPKKEIPDQFGLRYSGDFGFWTSPFLMQSANKRVVQRSAALLPSFYGNDFGYAECIKERNFFRGIWSVCSLFLLGFSLFFPPIRGLLFWLGILPRPGQGPSVEDETKARWNVTLYGLVEPDETQKAQIVKARISDHYGGYTSTARMAVECVMCHVLEKERLQALSLPQGGVLTPAAALGDVLVQRLIAAAFKLETL